MSVPRSTNHRNKVPILSHQKMMCVSILPAWLIYQCCHYPWLPGYLAQWCLAGFFPWSSSVSSLSLLFNLDITSYSPQCRTEWVDSLHFTMIKHKNYLDNFTRGMYLVCHVCIYSNVYMHSFIECIDVYVMLCLSSNYILSFVQLLELW